jgi:hypothetical protein
VAALPAPQNYLDVPPVALAICQTPSGLWVPGNWVHPPIAAGCQMSQSLAGIDGGFNNGGRYTQTRSRIKGLDWCHATGEQCPSVVLGFPQMGGDARGAGVCLSPITGRMMRVVHTWGTPSAIVPSHSP